MPEFELQEIQGLYGPFTLSERVVQKIWLRRDFDDDRLKTLSGKPLRVIDPGRWNLQGGPDFKEARLEIAGHPVVGDVEVHFNVADWWAHAHADNPAFDRVALHVVLDVNERPGPPARTAMGREPEVLHLLPHLDRDLETYATDDALLDLENLDELEWVAAFLARPLAERRRIIHERADARWEQKVAFAEKRLKETGWKAACHQFTLEVLGYARNREAMAKLALRYPLRAMVKQVETSGAAAADAFFGELSDEWRLDGLRPANHPRKRLEQYTAILQANPEWARALRLRLEEWPEAEPGTTTKELRKANRLRALADDLQANVLANALGEKRFHTLMVDAVLPLADADGRMDAAEYWRHWWPGDFPDGLRRFLKQTELTGPGQPLTNGLVQGGLSLFLSRG